MTTSRLHEDIPSLKDLCRQNAHKSPGDPAVRDRNQSLTWKEYNNRSQAAGNAYQAYAGKGERVAFLCESSVDHAVMLMGAIKAGCIVTNLHTRAAPGMLEYCIEETTPSVIVVDEAYSDTLHEIWGDATRSVTKVVTIGDPTHDYEQSMAEFVRDAPAEEPDVLTEEDDIAFIWWTSGSTGRPKGWCQTNRSLYLKGMKGVARYGVDRSGKTLIAFSPSFGAWSNAMLNAILGCESVYFLQEWTPRTWVETVEEQGITHAGMVGTMWSEVLDLNLNDYDLSSLTSIYSTGEKMDRTTLQRLRENICDNVHQSYGSTEMYGTVLYNDEMEGDRIESIGKPQTGTEVRIIEQDGSPDDELGPHEVGEIAIWGPDVPAWIWGDSEKTHESFEDGWWLSGDLGHKDEEGYIYLDGRADFMIKSRGVKIMPASVEEALNAHPGVEQSVVVGVDDPDYGQRVTAIVSAADEDLTAEELDEWCLDSTLIADYERPRSYRFTDSIDKTSSGKLDRAATKAKFDFE